MEKKMVSILVCCMLVFTGFQITQAKEAVIAVELPKVNEILGQAKKAGIVNGWEKRISLESRAYDKMPAPEKAFEVGKVLADIAFLVLNKEEEEISRDVLDKAEKAILSLNPPSDIAEHLKMIRSGVEVGKLKGKELRAEIDKLLKILPKISREPSIEDTGTMVWTSGFCRALYLATSTVAGMKEPEKNQITMFRYGSMADYFIRYFNDQAEDSFKNNGLVKDLIAVLEKIKPDMEKKPDKIVKEDIVRISDTLRPYFKDVDEK